MDEDQELSDDEDENLSGKKGFKAIPKSMCQTIRVMNPTTNRFKRTFKCMVEGCGRTFAKSCNMAVHLRKHTGAKPYSCAHCPKTFSQSRSSRGWGDHPRLNYCLESYILVNCLARLNYCLESPNFDHFRSQPIGGRSRPIPSPEPHPLKLR